MFKELKVAALEKWERKVRRWVFLKLFRKRRFSKCSHMVRLSVRGEMLHRVADTLGSFRPG